MSKLASFYRTIPEPKDLKIEKETEAMVLFEPFLLENPKTSNEFPANDEPYYTSLEYQLRHLLYKYLRGWITSERQVIYSSDECISTIHFVFDELDNVVRINVFQRSSNILNLDEDCQFFNYFIKKYCDPELVDLTIFVSMPHQLIGRKKKVE